MKTLLISFILFASIVVAQSQTASRISGRVISAKDGSALTNVSVVLSGSLHFTYVSRTDGTFRLNLDKESGTIIVSAKGYETIKLPITKDSSNLVIILKEKSFSESDIVDDIRNLYHKSTESSLIPTYSKEDGAVDKKSKLMGKPSMARGGVSDVIALSAGVSSAPPPAGGDLSGAYPDGEVAGRIPMNETQAESGLLTAGEVNDFSKWIMWKDIADGILSENKELWKLYPLERYTLQLENELRSPVFGATVYLLDNSFVVWASRTDNTGKAELWFNPFTDRIVKGQNISIEIEYGGRYYQIKQAKKFSEGINFFRIETGCLKPKFADIAFVVDATGSMGDEINYLKMDLQAIMKNIKDTLPNISFNLGSVFYRDTTDEYHTRFSDFSSDIDVTTKFISQQEANGGGDYPEAVHRGLDVAINQMSWRDDAMTKVIFLVLDAPPHTRPDVIAEIQALTLKAAEKGIRIIPVACSGVDKSTEYLLRSIALLTNGTYTFLTDDSGIGNPHIKPTTDKFDVETLSQLLVRLVYQYSYYPECEINYPLLVQDTLNVKYPEKGGDGTEDIDEAGAFAGFKYYPNPTFGDLNIEFAGKAEELFIADVNGKIIFRLENKGQNKLFINISEFPSGMYFIMYQYAPDKWLKGKLVLMH